MSADISAYTGLITSEHADKPHFVAVISALVQGLADMTAVTNSMPALFDIDDAAGQQLDFVGQWVGQTRDLSIPLTGIYLTLDTGPGLDSGALIGPFDPTSGLVSLPDTQYRTLLRARIANNQWDGTVPGAYTFMEAVFPAGDTFFIQDNCDMTMNVGVAGSVPLDAITTALLTGGYLNIKPAGVRINEYVTPSIWGTPIFALDMNNGLFSGLDQGAFANITSGN